MSELFGQMNAAPSMDGELLRAMAGKVMNLGEAVKEGTEATKKLAEHMEGIGELKERLAVHEKQRQEQGRKEADLAATMQEVVAKADILSGKVEYLQGALREHSQLFEKPLDKTVRYHHFLGRSFWVLFGMVAITACALSMMVWQWQRAGQYARDEMKWRFLKLNSDSVVAMVVDRAESEGENDPGGFAKSVRTEEDRREDLAKNILREQEVRRRIEELEKQKVKK